MARESNWLSDQIGTENATKVAVAYDRAMSILTLDSHLALPSADARLHMIRAMITSGEDFGFDEDRLTLAALASAGRTP